MEGEALQRLMDSGHVPGVAIAVIRAGRVDRLLCRGVRRAQGNDAIDADTVFDAASLSKPVFALVVLQLVEQGRLQLDESLVRLLPGYIRDDPQADLITVASVLSHCCGLPNWRAADTALRTYFLPGARFSYSGEGYLYLQRAIEAVTGAGMELLAQRLVFEPLGMSRSSFVWQERFRGNRAWPHDLLGRPALGSKPGESNAAASLQTTARDYGRFLEATLAGELLSGAMSKFSLKPHIDVKHSVKQAMTILDEPRSTGVAWGLGWGLEPDCGTFFQWGDNNAFKAFAIGAPGERSAVAIFTNASGGLSIVPDLLEAFLPGPRPSLAWLEYERHDAPRFRFLKRVLHGDGDAIRAELDGLGPEDREWIAKALDSRGWQDEAERLRKGTTAT